MECVAVLQGKMEYQRAVEGGGVFFGQVLQQKAGLRNSEGSCL